MARGRNPGELTKLQKHQGSKSREAIVAAAKTLFAEESFIATSVDDIVQKSAVSRVTFYKHFASKIDVATAILDQYLDEMLDDFASLASIADPTVNDIVNWIQRLLAIYRERPQSMESLASLLRQDAKLSAKKIHTYSTTISRLGEGIPAFALAASGADESARVRAHLLLNELEYLLYDIAIGQWDVDEQLAIRLVASRFREFISANPDR